ncbi:MAG: 6-carboxytetrahydropterin synthase [Candidatus Neomarinimicrobiota bacterium]|nr:6-carboxytetrahydropterin synthase [Candidatus Neomarinimicrobiota bacterium]
MPFLTKKFTFCAAHQYGHLGWSKEKNEEVFGDDARLHGHNYDLEVTVTGSINKETGFLADLGELKNIVQEKVLDIIDHSTIEKDIPWFADRQPSTELMVIWIWEQIEPELGEVQLHRIRLRETPTIYTDYFGPDGE